VNTVYAIKIPAGTIVYEGPVGSQGGIFVGGDDIWQIFVHEPWKLPGVEVVGNPIAIK
jgi:filamentous hemagglutinin